jgi:hypothetical protein
MQYYTQPVIQEQHLMQQFNTLITVNDFLFYKVLLQAMGHNNAATKVTGYRMDNQASDFWQKFFCSPQPDQQ